MRLSVCIDAVFQEKNFLEAMKTVKETGYQAYEFWQWWEKDIKTIEKAQKALGLKAAAFCTKFVSLLDPVLRQDYIKGLKETLEIAKLLDCRTIISQIGYELKGVSREEQYQSVVSGLKGAAPFLERADTVLVVEPLNVLVNHKGYFLVSSWEAFNIIDEVGSPNIRVLYDIYHQQITEGNLISTISANISKIGHFHAAGNPGRHEITSGEINYSEVFRAIRKTNYEGYIGLEYHPQNDAAEGLKQVLDISRPTN
jgi:hydroxypyruvate isomerase